MATTRENLQQLIKNLKHKLERTDDIREIEDLGRRLRLAHEGMDALDRLDRLMEDDK